MALKQIVAGSIHACQPTTLLAIMVALGAITYFAFLRKPNLNMPAVVPDPGPEGVFNTLTRMYEKYPDTPFILKTSRPIVILPGNLVDDVKNMPEDKVSLHAEVKIDHSMAVTKVGGGTYGTELLPTVRIDLTRHTNGAIPAILDELRFAMDIELHDVGSEQWSTKMLHMSVTKMSALMLSRIFIGRPISRRPEWLRSAIGYTIDLMRARHALNKYPYWMRLLIGKYVPEVKQMQSHLECGKKILMPIVENLVKERAAMKDPNSWKHEKKPLQHYMSEEEALEFDDAQGTFCSWLLKYTVIPKGASLEDIATSLALNQLALSWVSIHSVSYTVTRAMYDLATRPEYFAPLRQEIEEVLQQDGFTTDDKGRRIMGRTSYVKLRRLDSFLRESMRLCPNKLVNMARIVQSPVTLSTGHTLPSGTRIGVPVYHVMTSPSTRQTYADAAGQAPAGDFDGFRFYKLRREDGNENRFHYITTTSDYLAWGLGTHSCPGRFFSSTAIKVLFVEMLRFWDFRLVGDEERKGGPAVGHRLNDFTLTTDVTVPLEIKRREGAN
ncbi:Cytochrome P450 monooxygenase BOA7 [Colletotrichum spinosum]|uniref:Cytochrome P450 monooxygenase BOA7 n=1 Tax=Colletotrichum spinosum TaxID=1347390 RepID=A0A4R8PX00_9PEZI|nr:Cytochrome P450 monooxygenase BOA7 [Colletotrichum spinosum]